MENITHEENGQWVNPTGINVEVTKKGSMTKELFPKWCRHFVTNLPKGMGKGGKPVILVFDGHASRWNYAGLTYLLQNNVFCLCLPGHTSIWAQPNDCGPNSSLKSRLGDAVAQFRASHRPLPGSEGLMRLTRGNFNEIFVQAWLTFQNWSLQDLAQLGTNAIKSGWKGTGLCPYNRRPPNWEAAIARFGQRDELQVSAECEMPRGAAEVLPLVAHSAELQQMFAAAAAKRAATAAPAASEPPPTAPQAGGAPSAAPSTGGAPTSAVGAASAVHSALRGGASQQRMRYSGNKPRRSRYNSAEGSHYRRPSRPGADPNRSPSQGGC